MGVIFVAFNLDKNATADYFIALCNKFSQDEKVIVIASKIRPTNTPLHSSIEVFKWPSYHPSKWKDFFFLFRLAKKYRPHTMIAIFGSVNMFLIIGALFRAKNRIAWIRSLSTQFEQKRFNVLRRRILYKLSTQIIVNSNATKIDASNFYKISKSKIEVLPNSVKDYKHKVKDISIKKYKILYVGRLHSTKGIDVLINATSNLLNQGYDLDLEIIGGGPLYQSLKSLVSTLGIDEKVNFIGEQNKHMVLSAYKESYCTVIPSVSEAFGFTVIEAMSVGTCVIGADNTGIKEIIVHNESGLLFETNSVASLSQQLEKILFDESLRNQLAINGYERFKHFYENEYAINRDFNFFQAIVKNNK